MVPQLARRLCCHTGGRRQPLASRSGNQLGVCTPARAYAFLPHVVLRLGWPSFDAVLCAAGIGLGHLAQRFPRPTSLSLPSLIRYPRDNMLRKGSEGGDRSYALLHNSASTRLGAMTGPSATTPAASHVARSSGARAADRGWVNAAKKGTGKLARHWLGWFNFAWAVVFALPWLAPVFMKVGATWAGQAIYVVYSFLCHQFADRSFFLFGPQVSYAASELLPLAPTGDPHLAMRAFRGTPALGYKVAWSDRMVALYGGVLLGGLVFALVRRWVRRPKLVWPALLLLPMAVDGSTHVLSDLAGLGAGFRYTNAWLAALTQNRLGEAFYAGNALGSFNAWARLISGTLAGLAVVWAGYTALEAYFRGVQSTLHAQVSAGRPVTGVAVYDAPAVPAYAANDHSE